MKGRSVGLASSRFRLVDQTAHLKRPTSRGKSLVLLESMGKERWASEREAELLKEKGKVKDTFRKELT